MKKYKSPYMETVSSPSMKLSLLPVFVFSCCKYFSLFKLVLKTTMFYFFLYRNLKVDRMATILDCAVRGNCHDIEFF